MKFKLFSFFLFLFIFLFSKPILSSVKAADLTYPNNKFGIHLATPADEDIQKASDLINSSGGDWGYITLVITENELDKKKWQEIFDKLRTYHLIPIIRIATSFENGSWRAPKIDDIQKWTDFLNSLNWVVKNRFVVLFNEVNRADEWGGQVNSTNFTQVIYSFSKALKEANPNFFVMMAGFDSAAPHLPPEYEDEAIFLRKALLEKSDLFEYLDGWASHSYPKSRYSFGRNSVFNYQWELSFLKSLGVSKNLPVFITETGWCHQEGQTPDLSFPDQETVANLIQGYFLQLLSDNQVIGFTPFILNYQQEPFDHYSWQRNINEFYPQYGIVKTMTKTKGEPKQEEKLAIKSKLPEKLIKNSTYQLALLVKNEGQSIWNDKNNDYQLSLEGLPEDAEYFFSDFSQVRPFEEKTIWLYLKTGEKLGELPLKISLKKDEQIVDNQSNWDLEIIQETTIKIMTKILFRKKAQGDDFKFLIYNQNEEIVYGVNRFSLKDGQTEIKGLKNLIIGDQYRLVLIKPFYLPRQTFLIIEEKDNQVSFKVLLPFDFNQDGRFSLGDILTLIKKPKLFNLF